MSGLLEDDGAVFSETFEFEIQDDMSAQSKSSKDDATVSKLAKIISQVPCKIVIWKAQGCATLK